MSIDFTRLITQIARVRLGGVPIQKPDNDERREQGRVHCSNVMLYWFAQNEWTHPNFADLADWALNEDRAVHPSQISHIRNKKMRMFGLRVLDGFGAINTAVWAANNDTSYLTDMGVRPMTPEIEDLVMGKTAIMHPYKGTPLTQGDWMELFLGYLTIPAALPGDLDLDSAEYRNACKQVGSFLNELIMDSGLDPMSACNKISAKVGPQKAQDLMSLIMGFRSLTPEQLQDEIMEIIQAATALDGVKRDPSSLVKELVSIKKKPGRNGNG